MIPPQFNFIHRAVQSARVARCFIAHFQLSCQVGITTLILCKETEAPDAKQFSQVQELMDKSALKHGKTLPRPHLCTIHGNAL